MTATSGDEPCSAASPCGATASTTACHRAPPSTRAVRATGSTLTTAASSVVRTQHDVVQPALREGGGPVAAALGRDAQPGGAPRPHDGDDVRHVAGHGHGGGSLVDRDVPRHPGGVVAGVSWQVHRSAAQAAQGLGGLGGAGVVEGGLDGHGAVLRFLGGAGRSRARGGAGGGAAGGRGGRRGAAGCAGVALDDLTRDGERVDRAGRSSPPPRPRAEALGQGVEHRRARRRRRWCAR